MESPRQFLGRGFVEKWQGPGFFFLRMMGAFFWDPKISKADATKWINMDEYGSTDAYNLSSKSTKCRCLQHVIRWRALLHPRCYQGVGSLQSFFWRVWRGSWGDFCANWGGMWSGGMDWVAWMSNRKKKLPRFCRLVVFLVSRGTNHCQNYWSQATVQAVPVTTLPAVPETGSSDVVERVTTGQSSSKFETQSWVVGWIGVKQHSYLPGN